ncbi:hypothetical protein KY329_01985 [Candidatus Woesearchaeota archaeon]|nr:hypothetical protein [Candidatus Woesearchaeota archaeon]
MGDFEQELDEYISSRKKASIKGMLAGIFGPKEKKVKMPEDVTVYQSRKEKKFSLKSLGNAFSKKEDEQLIRYRLEAEDAVSDMKEIAKVALVAIKQLPDDQLAVFKQGPEFEKLKYLLKKHDLIR